MLKLFLILLAAPIFFGAPYNAYANMTSSFSRAADVSGKNWYLVPELGLAQISYYEQQGDLRLAQNTLEGIIKAGYVVPHSPLNFSASTQSTLAIFAATLDDQARFFHADALAGYELGYNQGTSLNLTAGIVANAMFVRQDHFGYAYVVGPQIGPEFRRHFVGSGVLQVSAKAGLLSGFKQNTWIFQNNEFIIGTGYEFLESDTPTFKVGLSFTRLNLNSEINRASNNSAMMTAGLTI